MSERGEKQPAERPDYFSDFPEEFEQHPDAPSRDLARREREQADRDPIVPRSEPKASGEVHQDSAVARIEAMKQRVRDLEKK
jgi:hypothetical protein